MATIRVKERVDWPRLVDATDYQIGFLCKYLPDCTEITDLYELSRGELRKLLEKLNLTIIDESGDSEV